MDESFLPFPHGRGMDADTIRAVSKKEGRKYRKQVAPIT